MSNYIHSYLNTPIKFNPYQYKPLMELRNNPDTNLLISDEVGLGKTIEAGIIIDDLLTRNSDAKVLIICPAFLRDKWASEMEEKFYYSSAIFGKNYIPEGENITILPISKLKQFDEMELCGYDLIVVDEIHYFKNNASRRYIALHRILERNNQAKRVFMSATPINNKSNDYNSIRILIGGAHSTTNTTKKQSYIDLKKRNIKDIWIELSPEEEEIYDATDDLPAFSGTVYRHIGASSIHSLYTYANQGTRTELKDELMENFDYILMEADIDDEFESDFAWNPNHILPEADTKLNVLLDTLDSLEDTHVVIFSHYVETVKYLYEKVRYHLEHAGSGRDNVGYIYANCSSINIPLKNRKNRFSDAKRWFDVEDKKRILICSDSCKEGVDLQVASVLINYDLPFNPSIIEQRIGRIDRTGQRNDMKIYNFHVDNTYDDRLHMILSTKLRLINYYAQYGIGNPLNISDNGSSKIFDGFIKYFAKSALSNDDIETTLRMLRKVFDDVPTIISVKDDNSILMRFMIEHKKEICEWFAADVEEQENDILREDKEAYIKYLDLPENPGIVVCEFSEDERKYIADKCNDDPIIRIKYMPLIKNSDKIMTSLEEYGEVAVISSEDIYTEYIHDYENTDADTFVPYELINNIG